MIPAIDRCNDKKADRNCHPSEKIPGIPEGETEHGKRDAGVTAGKSVPLDTFEQVQGILDRLRNEEPFQVPGLQMMYSETRPERRHEHVADIRKIEAE